MLVNTTLCYLEQNDSYLMLHRTKKEGDLNKDKWIGIGGHMEEGESPEDCILREALEETGYHLKRMSFRGLVTFVYKDVTEYMSLFTADRFEGTPTECTEGELEWVPKSGIGKLNLWEGDRIFFRLLEENAPFFSLKLVYSPEDVLQKAVLNGKELSLA